MIPENFTLFKTIDSNALIVRGYPELAEDNREKYGIINQKGDWIVKPVYRHITTGKDKRYAFLFKRYELDHVNLRNKHIQSLRYSIWEKNELFLEFSLKDRDQNDPIKTGLLDYESNIVLEPIYNVIYFCHHPERFIAFTGKSGYIHLNNEQTRTLGDYDNFRGLNLGKCGLLDQDKRVIIPFEHEFITEISLGHYAVNQGGEIFECETHTGKEDDPYILSTVKIKGGVWHLFDEDGVQKNELTKLTVNVLLDAFEQYHKAPVIAID